MPYVNDETRARYEGLGLTELANQLAFDADGALNYVVTRLCVRRLGSKPGYQDFNAVVGALECAKLELYRRAAAPYEDAKAEENGDVYGDR